MVEKICYKKHFTIFYCELYTNESNITNKIMYIE